MISCARSGNSPESVAAVELADTILGDKVKHLFITCNKNGIPFDEQKPWITSGIRLGTPACTTRGLGLAEFKLIGEYINEVLQGLKNNKDDNSVAEKEVAQKVKDLCNNFPIY